MNCHYIFNSWSNSIKAVFRATFAKENKLTYNFSENMLGNYSKIGIGYENGCQEGDVKVFYFTF